MIEEVFQSIASGREWSWSLMGLAALFFGLFVRSIVLRDILRGLRIRNKSWYRRAQTFYQGRAILGWIFFVLFEVGVVLYWRFEPVVLTRLGLFQVVTILVALLAASIFCHLKAYARAIVEAIQENVATDKDF